jgi:crotonobetainyl-CoA:carnitine CoA-transferase CaiB-like acyl-CoA transferase
MGERERAGALAGFRVLDLSRLLPGPFCSMLLGDMGADVIKVEEPGQGDYIRWWPPTVGRQNQEIDPGARVARTR